MEKVKGGLIPFSLPGSSTWGTVMCNIAFTLIYQGSIDEANAGMDLAIAYNCV